VEAEQGTGVLKVGAASPVCGKCRMENLEWNWIIEISVAPCHSLTPAQDRLFCYFVTWRHSKVMFVTL